MTGPAEWECDWARKRLWLVVTQRGTCGKGPLHVRMCVVSSNNIQLKRCRYRAKWRTGLKIVLSVQKVKLLKNLNIYIFNLYIVYVHVKHMYGDLRIIYRSWVYSSTMLILGVKLRLADLATSKSLNLLSYHLLASSPIRLLELISLSYVLPGHVAQLVESMPSTQEALDSIPAPHKTGCAGACLWSQCVRGDGG